VVEAGNGDGADIVVVQCAMEENQRKTGDTWSKHNVCILYKQWTALTHLLSLQHKGQYIQDLQDSHGPKRSILNAADVVLIQLSESNTGAHKTFDELKVKIK